MKQSTTSSAVKFLVLITYLGMVIINGLANALPINGMNTGKVSDSYPNLFAPTGLTFIIWGVIYLLLAGYTAYQLGLFQQEKKTANPDLLNKIGILFSISSLANFAWIFSWHYKVIPLSMLFMLVILVCLILITNLIKKENLTPNEKLFVRLPFSVYFGWITVATIANATVLLVSLGWNGFGISQVAWTVVILLVGWLIGTLTTLRNKDAAYGLVLIWAYFGILLKHLSSTDFAFKYPPVVYTVIVSLLLFVVAVVYVLTKGKTVKTIN